MIDILTTIAPLFIIIFASALVQYIKKSSDTWMTVLNSFALNIGLPALVFLSLAKAEFSFKAELNLILVNSLLLISGFIISYLISKIFNFSKKMLKTLFISITFGNIAYLGIPVLVQNFGEEVLPKIGIILAIYLFWIFTIGIGFLEYSQTKKKRDVLKAVLLKLIKNPLLISVFLGIIVSIFKIKLPNILDQSLSMLSVSVTPMVLVVIGLFVGSSKIGKIKEWIPVLLFSISTLIILPGLLFYILKFSSLGIENFKISLIEAAMPLAITPFALADTYKLDKIFIARAIVLSTCLSIISLPFWINIV